MSFQPTDEQAHAAELAATGEDMVVEALAGTGKTTTSVLMAEQAHTAGREGLYVAFNKAIVEDGKDKFPESVLCSTVHGMAMRAVGKTFAHRLGGGRMKSRDIADLLGITPLNVTYQGKAKRLSPSFLAGLTMRAMRRFSQTDADKPSRFHVPWPEAARAGEDGKLSSQAVDLRQMYGQISQHLEPFLQIAWMDLSRPDGRLPYDHNCQPPGTLVRRVVKYGGGVSGEGVYEDVPIEDILPGDRVVSFTMGKRRGYVRRAGRLVKSVGSRPHNGILVRVETSRGRVTKYTPDHKCVVRVDVDLTDGNHVVYIARKGDRFRVGRTTWRTPSQKNGIGIHRRVKHQDADAAWILSVHSTEADAALAEAEVAYKWNIPSWQFNSNNELTPLDKFWALVGDQTKVIQKCLAVHGRDIRYPMWEVGEWSRARQPIVMRACNLLNGFLVCEPDEISPCARGELRANDGSGAWAPIAVSDETYRGVVWNLDVETDHTYVADGVVTHNCYLKHWQMSDPVLEFDYVLVDEAQDMNPVMRSIIDQQDDLQKIWIGDSRQQIYEWNGSVNAMSHMDAEHRAWLTQSFRFGPEIAEEANKVLRALGCEVEITGSGPEGFVGLLNEPGVILSRTNAKAVSDALHAIDRGLKPHVVGGTSDVVGFCRAAKDLMDNNWTSHPELACFDNWTDVIMYVHEDELGGDLALLVGLIEEFGADRIIGAMSNQPKESEADLVLSTAHKSKGREWESVKLASDFKDEPSEEEMRLLYVANTRAMKSLDNQDVDWMRSE